jgi:NADH:ubiquinone reductase (H+-translocating)
MLMKISAFVLGLSLTPLVATSQVIPPPVCKPPAPYTYRDFGSLVSLGRYDAIGSVMGFLVGRNFGVEGLIARLIYRSLYKMHEYALSGGRKVFFSILARGLSRKSEPQVKLH